MFLYGSPAAGAKLGPSGTVWQHVMGRVGVSLTHYLVAHQGSRAL